MFSARRVRAPTGERLWHFSITTASLSPPHGFAAYALRLRARTNEVSAGSERTRALARRTLSLVRKLDNRKVTMRALGAPREWGAREDDSASAAGVRGWNPLNKAAARRFLFACFFFRFLSIKSSFTLEILSVFYNAS